MSIARYELHNVDFANLGAVYILHIKDPERHIVKSSDLFRASCQRPQVCYRFMRIVSMIFIGINASVSRPISVSAFSNYSVTTVPPPQVTKGPGSTFGQNSTDNAPAGDCAVAGRNTTISSNSTCAQVAMQFSVTEADILSSNPTLNSDCNIASGTTLCLPQACHTYVIKTNDTCDSVSQVAGTMTGTNITTTQLLSFNPELGTFCQAMPNRVGLLICLTPNGGFPNVGASSAAVPSGMLGTLIEYAHVLIYTYSNTHRSSTHSVTYTGWDVLKLWAILSSPRWRHLQLRHSQERNILTRFLDYQPWYVV